MGNIIEGLNITFSELFRYIISGSHNELSSVIFHAVILLIILILQNKIRTTVDTHDFAKERYFLFIIDLLFPLIFPPSETRLMRASSNTFYVEEMSTS